MKTRLLLASVAILGAASPAYAQENIFTFDYMASTSTHSLEAGASQAQYQLDSAFESGSSLVNQLSLAYGLTNTLTVAGALQMGGVGGTALGSTSYQAGLLYAPGLATHGWTPALMLQYQGGFDDAMIGRAAFSYDALVPAFVNGALDRFNFTTNVSAEQPFEGDSPLEWGYSAGLSYPLVGKPMDEAPEGNAVQQLQRRPTSLLRAGLELQGDLSADGSHYAVPQLQVAPSETWGVSVGVGLRLAGQERPVYVQAQVQSSF